MAASDLRSDSTTIAVVTVSFRSDSVLPDFLNSLADASPDPLFVVVADNSPDGSGEVRRLTEAARARYLPLSENRGYGAGMDAAIQSLPSTVRWVLVSNPDVRLSKKSIATLVAMGETDPRIAAVGPAIYSDDGLLYPSARSIPSLRNGVGHALFANIWPTNPWTAAYRQDTDSAPRSRDAGWLSGACVLIRRSAFLEIGGFDTGYFMYFEDVDLGYRLGRAGYRNVYEPAAHVVHTGAHSTTSEASRMVSAHHASARRFLGKKYPGWRLWPVRLVLNVGLAARSAIVRFSSHRSG
jgi:N-acetylglucosaminyl-diphospho-decaprenol L-rhamnosyltransferase